MRETRLSVVDRHSPKPAVRSTVRPSPALRHNPPFDKLRWLVRSESKILWHRRKITKLRTATKLVSLSHLSC